MNTTDPTVLAIRYGTMLTSRAHEFHRYGVYDEPDEPLPMDYYFWAIQAGDETTLVDCGYHPDALKDRPGRVCFIPPVEALAAVGIDADSVSTVVVSHFHFDHIGNLAAFPNARFHVQKRELAFWTGPHGRHLSASASVEASEIEFILEANRQGRVDLVDGDTQILPGINGQLSVGHCPGQQIVEIEALSPILICSDALHFYEELDRFMPYNVFFDLEGMFETYASLARQRDAGATIVAGHDPRVMDRFPALEGHEGLAVVVSEGPTD